MSRSPVPPLVHPVSETAAAIELAGAADPAAQRRIWWLADRFKDYPGAREVVPGMMNLTVDLDPERGDVDQLRRDLESAWAESDAATPASRHVEIPVHYGGSAGPDLAFVAQHAGLSPGEVIELHSGATYTVFFLGFLPGFAYLGGLDPRLAMPRRAEPRLAVPPGSLGIGGEQTGIYPLASPGGWQLIGRTSLRMFDPLREAPSLLLPGDTVKFLNAGESS
jgi:KipI family sensor histidine kinase inhibitor